MRLLISVFVVAFACVGCRSDDGDESPAAQKSYFVAEYSSAMNTMAVSDGLYLDAQPTGSLEQALLSEASGLAVSAQDTSLLWSHNDSRDMNRIFLFGKNGDNHGVFRLLGSGNRDWEDMGAGPGPVEGIHYLYIADIGDNHKQWPEVYLYRLPEPDVHSADTSLQWVDIQLDVVERFSVKYPDGPRDAETLLLDPWTLDLYVISKSDFPARIYRLAYPYHHGEQYTFELYGTLPITLLTGGDISGDGKQIVLKTKERVWRWKREEGESLKQAFLREPVRLPYLPEPQGEAIAFEPEGNSYYTLSEKGSSSLPPVIYFYKSLEE